jgi:hypothetical protein
MYKALRLREGGRGGGDYFPSHLSFLARRAAEDDAHTILAEPELPRHNVGRRGRWRS